MREIRDRRVDVRLSYTERQLLDLLAQAERRTPSDSVRQLLVREAERRGLVAEQQRMGNAGRSAT